MPLASLPGGLEKRITELLNLIYQKCEHHPVMKYGREMLVAQSKVVFEVVSGFLKALNTSFFIRQRARPVRISWYTFSGVRGKSITQLNILALYPYC